MQIKPLAGCDFSLLTACFNEAFSDYFVPFNVDETYLKDRWAAAGVDYRLSRGAYIGERLVGFIMIALADWDGELSHYNAGTGVIPDFRGQGIVGEMYAPLFAELQDRSVRQGLLEVIVQNERAIKAYQKNGYQIERRLSCFKGDFPVTTAAQNAAIKRSVRPDWEAYPKISPFVWTWDSQTRTAQNYGDAVECWEYREHEQLLAFAIYHRASKRLVQWGEAFGTAGVLNLLLRQILSGESEVRINNIDASATAEIQRMTDLGISPTVDQYEMWQR
ncbi:MAG: GNAT family N-acetyltransferase [Bacteroidia bacterium]